ncbi:MAG: peptidylprolyl isomerase [Candidatus Poribacteria bacterium]
MDMTTKLSIKSLAITLIITSLLISTKWKNSVYAATELAKVNDTVITLEDFNKKYKDNLKFFQFKAPTKEGVLEDLIRREIGIQEAKRQKIDKDPEVIERMNTVLYHALLDRKLSKEFETIHVTDEEAKEFYKKNPEIRTSHIFISVKPDANQEEVKRAHEKIKTIYNDHVRPGKLGFAEIAQRFSEGVAAPMGGDIDYQTRDKLDPTYYQTALKLSSPGKISEIVRSQFGYHVIKLTAIKAWGDVDKSQVKRQVFDERRAKIFDNFMNTLRQQSHVSIHKELIKD